MSFRVMMEGPWYHGLLRDGRLKTNGNDDKGRDTRAIWTAHQDGLLLLLTIIVIAVFITIIFNIILSSWYRLILFLIYIGGIMVIFSYFVIGISYPCGCAKFGDFRFSRFDFTCGQTDRQTDRQNHRGGSTLVYVIVCAVHVQCASRRCDDVQQLCWHAQYAHSSLTSLPTPAWRHRTGEFRISRLRVDRNLQHCSRGRHRGSTVVDEPSRMVNSTRQRASVDDDCPTAAAAVTRGNTHNIIRRILALLRDDTAICQRLLLRNHYRKIRNSRCLGFASE